MNQHQEAQCMNLASMRDLPLGAHLASKRHGYTHHGIYVGRGRVIHYAGLSRGCCGGPIEAIPLEHFSAGFGIEIVRHPDSPYTGAEVAHRAASRLGERNYRLLTNNCEHLCQWCVCGNGKSAQVQACIRNPARAVTVLITLLVCKLVRDWRSASLLRTSDCLIAALNY
ncbi:hydrolase [Paraburkholderia sp. UYCP14C]|uniref:lecithin retinol acyltransferase family protein n=1 Tax=Paraburkholderia sp. UYCP14C TaxID=2511130 RepID=UPI001020E9FB|nr:lecithin retinol acyltransferase family protein [Paraburkholderia sp. UYCP14C]RZF28974.1 hydrolase [Paraburkholderia sp. UYCP14C]